MKQKLFSLLVVFFVLFSLLPTFYELKRSNDVPADRSFELVHNYITDYNFYLSRIREGWDGRWTVVERYTNEPHEGSLIQEFYLLLGKAGRMIPDPTTADTYVYYAAVVIGALLLLSCTVWAATHVFPAFFWSLTAFLLAVVACGWPIIVPVGSSWRFGGYMSWFTVVETLQRITFLPHVLVGQALVLFLIIAGNHMKTLQKKGNSVFLGLLALLLGMIFPPGLIFVGVGYIIGMVIDTVWDWSAYTKQHRWNMWWKECVTPRAIAGCISIPALVYYTYMLTLYPWRRLAEFDQLHPLIVSVIEYMKVLGPVLPLGIIGLIVALWKKERQMLGIITWVCAWIMLFLIFSFVPQQSPLRFAEMAPHIPLAFLTVYLSKTVMDAVKKRRGVSYTGIFALAVPFICIAMGMGVMYSDWLWHKDFVDQKVIAGWPVIAMNNYIVYPSRGFIDGMTYLNYQTAPDSIILSDLVAGNYIPARSGRRVYVGHDNSMNKEEKLLLVKQFFHGDMHAQDAYVWLKREGISYIFYGPQEKEDGNALDIATHYPFLRQVSVNTDVTIYQLP